MTDRTRRSDDCGRKPNTLTNEWPVYLAISRDLEDGILSGEIPEGGAAPSVRVLTRHYGVSSTTAGRALRQLRDSNVLQARPGQKMRVAGGSRALIRACRMAALRPRYIEPLLVEATRLSIPLPEVLAALTRSFESELPGSRSKGNQD
ncbi:GntR family transcriptional regulator [Microbacterium lacticum]